MTVQEKNAREGYFGPYGGQFVPETLRAALDQLTQEYTAARNDPAFNKEFERCLREIAGRPSMLYFAQRLTRAGRGGEDLSQARGPQPHRRTRSTTRWARCCCASAWARRG